MKSINIMSLLTAIVTFAVLTPSIACADTYSQNWDTFTDGTQAFGDGSDLQSNNNVAKVMSNMLLLTEDGIASTNSAFHTGPLLNSSQGWTASFDFTLLDNADGSPPADGFSFNYGSLPAGLSPISAEEGFGVGLSIEFDTYLIDDPENGYNVAVDGVDVPGGFLNTNILLEGTTVNGNAVITYDPLNGVMLTVDTGSGPMVIFSNLAIPGFTADDTYDFAIAARTGGATETLTLDNLVISTPNSSTIAIPTLSQWSVILLILMLMTTGLLKTYRHL